MATLPEVNELAKYHSDFHLLSCDGHRLVLVGSFDLCYYHHIELHFTEVAHINCPVWFNDPEFCDGGPLNDRVSSVEEPREYTIRTREGEYQIIARSLEIVVGTVFYYKRDELKPGERIAAWVK